LFGVFTAACTVGQKTESQQRAHVVPRWPMYLTLTDRKDTVAVARERLKAMAEKHIARWLGGRSEFLKA
jgi:hypothetical protein